MQANDDTTHDSESPEDDNTEGLRERVERVEEQNAELRETVQKMLPNRREFLAGAGVAAIAGVSGVAGRASADASTSDSFDDVGQPGNRVDVFADGLDANQIEPKHTDYPDTGTDPSTNGEVRRNGGDVKIYSGGAVKNISNIGAGSFAPSDAQYVTLATDGDLSNERTLNAGNNLTLTDNGANSDVTLDVTSSNTPDWTEDGNSPVTNATGSSGSYTYTLSGTYDVVVAHVEYTLNSAVTRTPKMRANGDTGSNYRYRDVTASSTTSASEVPGIIGKATGNKTARGTLRMSGRWADNWGVRPLSAGGRTMDDHILIAQNTNISSPLNSFTFRDDSGNGITISMNVYGRDIS